MFSQFHLDYRDEDHRPYPAGRHRKPEPPKPALPAWAVEHPRTFDPGLVGEGPTRILPAPAAPLLMPLPSRAQGAALAAEATRGAKPSTISARLGQCLHALRSWGRP